MGLLALPFCVCLPAAAAAGGRLGFGRFLRQRRGGYRFIMAVVLFACHLQPLLWRNAVRFVEAMVCLCHNEEGILSVPLVRHVRQRDVLTSSHASTPIPIPPHDKIRRIKL